MADVGWLLGWNRSPAAHTRFVSSVAQLFDCLLQIILLKKPKNRIARHQLTILMTTTPFKRLQDTVFDSVSLTCGHIFCYMCACKSGSVTIVDGLQAGKLTAKCPLWREVCLLGFFFPKFTNIYIQYSTEI
ncbi:putative transcription factor C2H2 family [Helianthus anomalus]